MILAITLVRDEEDIIGYTLEHLSRQNIDHIIVADNLSTDATPKILHEWEMTGLVTVVPDDDPAHWQGAKMTRLAADFAQTGDWIIPFDADELWYSLDGRPLGDALRSTDADVAIGHPYVHQPTGQDGDDANPYLRMRHRQPNPEPHPKFAFRWTPNVLIDEGNHKVFNTGTRCADGVLGIRHFQYRTLEQTARKVRQGTQALSLTRFGPNVGTHWRNLATLTDEQLAEWWADYISQPTMLDPAPWSR